VVSLPAAPDEAVPDEPVRDGAMHESEPEQERS
jgi:hypothetical protein